MRFKLPLDFQYIDTLNPLEIWCNQFNAFSILFFQTSKYLLIVLLTLLGISKILKTRKYLKDIDSSQVITETPEHIKTYRKNQFVIGMFYFIVALGFLTNFFIYFLIAILNPIPDRIIFTMFDFYEGFSPPSLNIAQDINAMTYPHERTIYYFISLGSFLGYILIFLGILIFVNKRRRYYKGGLVSLMTGIVTGFIAGFNTFFPLML